MKDPSERKTVELIYVGFYKKRLEAFDKRTIHTKKTRNYMRKLLKDPELPQDMREKLNSLLTENETQALKIIK